MSRYLTSDNLQRTDHLNKLAQELGYSLAQLALAWILRRAEVASVILGVTSLEQLEHNLMAGEIKLITEEIERIEDCL